MKLTCSRQALTTAFATVSSVVPSRTPKEILKNIKLFVADGKATLIATDQEVGIRYELDDIETDSFGEVLLPQRVSQILREVRDEFVHFEATDDALWVRAGQSEFRLSVEDPAEFPNVPTFDDQDYYIIKGSHLKQGIARTIFATDIESTRYALGGVEMELEADHLTLAATDSRRLAVYKTSCQAQGSVTEEVGKPIIPAKAMSLIEKSIREEDEEVRVAIHKNDVLVKCGTSTIYARLVEGRFPAYQDVMPSSFNLKIELVVGPFLSAVRQAMIVTNEDSRGVDFSFDAGTLTLTSVGQDIGTSKIELPISYDGGKIIVAFDPGFVQEFLRVLEPASPITLNLVDPNNPAVFHAGDNYVYVIMPLDRAEKAKT